ncbi:site-specific integrase [Mucilaginibacter sp. PAMB04274]|uniref:site-specific integrase n=1 Tax=Mucilaginibacter sp. PAMB04274 TaxID=3138568 RepID=UPI0031F65470
MATFSAKVFKHHKKADGTYNVKICISHNRGRRYIDTPHYVNDKKLSRNLSIKDTFINSLINATLEEYRNAASRLGKRLALFDVEMLRDYLLNKDQAIDFMKFCQIHLDHLKENGQTKSEANYKTVRNSISDFTKSKPLPVEDITLTFLKSFERFLRAERKMIRVDQFGREYMQIGKPLSDASVHNYMREFRGFFTAAMAYYNKPSLGLQPITYNPFTEYKLIDPPETRKRNIDIEQVIKIRDCEVEPDSRAELARDMFMLSFYLCGINAVDLYLNNYKIKNGRIEYNRSKTKGKRQDKAFISINVLDEALPLLLKYRNMLSDRYSSIANLNKALSKGMADIRNLTGVSGITYYWARHTFGNLARNKCRKSKDDVALALNHVDYGRKTTDIYLEKDWAIVDEVQRAVLGLIKSHERVRAMSNQPSETSLFSFVNLPKLVK